MTMYIVRSSFDASLGFRVTLLSENGRTGINSIRILTVVWNMSDYKVSGVFVIFISFFFPSFAFLFLCFGLPSIFTFSSSPTFLSRTSVFLPLSIHSFFFLRDLIERVRTKILSGFLLSSSARNNNGTSNNDGRNESLRSDRVEIYARLHHSAQ